MKAVTATAHTQGSLMNELDEEKYVRRQVELLIGDDDRCHTRRDWCQGEVKSEDNHGQNPNANTRAKIRKSDEALVRFECAYLSYAARA